MTSRVSVTSSGFACNPVATRGYKKRASKRELTRSRGNVQVARSPPPQAYCPVCLPFSSPRPHIARHIWQYWSPPRRCLCPLGSQPSVSVPCHFPGWRWLGSPRLCYEVGGWYGYSTVRGKCNALLHTLISRCTTKEKKHGMGYKHVQSTTYHLPYSSLTRGA